MRTIVGMAQMPQVTRHRADLSAHYADRFTIDVPEVDRSAMEWARTILEETPSGRSAPLLWTAIGVRLGPRPSPDHVQGWRVVEQHETWATLGARTPYLEARAVVEAEGRDLSLALFVRYRVPLVGAVAWCPISVLHRRGVPTMLRQARRLAAPVDRSKKRDGR